MTEPGSSRLPMWLIVSLIANALLVGLLIGGGLQVKRYPGQPASDQRPFSRGLHANLPEEDRAIVREVFRRAAIHSREERQTVRQARRDLATALLTEPYDRAEVVRAFERLRQADTVVRQRLHEDLADSLESLSPQQRRAILASMDGGSRRHSPRSHYRADPPGPPPDQD